MVYYLIRIPLLLKSRDRGGEGGWRGWGEGRARAELYEAYSDGGDLVLKKGLSDFKLEFEKGRTAGKPKWHAPDSGKSLGVARQPRLARVKSGRNVNGDLSSDGEAHLGSLLAAVTWLADCVPRILAVKHAISRHIDFAQGSLTRQPRDARCRRRGEEGRKGRPRRKGEREEGDRHARSWKGREDRRGEGNEMQCIQRRS